MAVNADLPNEARKLGFEENAVPSMLAFSSFLEAICKSGEDSRIFIDGGGNVSSDFSDQSTLEPSVRLVVLDPGRYLHGRLLYFFSAERYD
ncbi:unnamed protein product [Protopolystoma xenopodis]|uniref:Uncharacterized protein n=1 Tax=Protopolystoma xenopodis TaxID=117903 RepID=A0A3S5B0V5_9PLAT|nr:unnamed protein product [Protopolystoma xenopodis]